MTRDDLEIALVAVRWAGAMAVLGLGVLWLLRRNSLRWLAAALAVLAVSIVAAGVFGTARAMFYSSHDYGVTLRVLVVSIIVAAVAATIAGTVLSRSSESGGPPAPAGGGRAAPWSCSTCGAPTTTPARGTGRTTSTPTATSARP